jgi:hypothetical protein
MDRCSRLLDGWRSGGRGDGSWGATRRMERLAAVWEESKVSERIEIARAREDTASFLMAIFDVAAVAKFCLDTGQSLQQELPIVAKVERVLARDSSGNLVNEDFTDGNVDGRTNWKLPMAERISAVGDSAHGLPMGETILSSRVCKYKPETRGGTRPFPSFS